MIKRLSIIVIAIVFMVTAIAGCKALSNVVKPKAAASVSVKSAACSLSQSKYLSIYSNFRYNLTGSQSSNLDQETGFFDLTNLPISWSGQSFYGSANSDSGWQGGESSPTKKIGECTLNGTMSKDMKTIDSLIFKQSIVWQSGDTQAGNFEIVNIPYKNENDFRESKGACKNCHIAFDRRGAIAKDSTRQWELQGTRGKNGALWKVTTLLWNDNNGLTVTFKYLNCDSN
jgi:hypothetical protein